MKKLSTLRLVVSTALLLLTPIVALAQQRGVKPDKKVDVCHVTGNGTYRLINISKSAQQAHIDHGDAIPGTLVGEEFVADDCTQKETTRASSAALSFSAMGWGGSSCPAGTTVVGGGYEPAEAVVAASSPAKPDSVVGGYTYPVFPHYTFASGETGWVVQNGNTAQTLTVYAICVGN